MSDLDGNTGEFENLLEALDFETPELPVVMCDIGRKGGLADRRKPCPRAAVYRSVVHSCPQSRNEALTVMCAECTDATLRTAQQLITDTSHWLKCFWCHETFTVPQQIIGRIEEITG